VDFQQGTRDEGTRVVKLMAARSTIHCIYSVSHREFVKFRKIERLQMKKSTTTTTPSNPKPRPSTLQLPPSTRAPDAKQRTRQTITPAVSSSHSHHTQRTDRIRSSDGEAQLRKILAECLEEVRKIDFHNSELDRQLRKSEQHGRLLADEIGELKQQLEEKRLVEESNLRLQARVLALERSKAHGPDTEKDDRKALAELQKQYSVLEGYYNELLLYVKELQKDEHSNSNLL
jgi:hypothetical protein